MLADVAFGSWAEKLTTSISCPQHLSNRTSPAPSDSTASCHKRTHAPQQTTYTDCNDLLDHLVGDGEHSGWNIEAEHFCGLEIDYQFELGRQHHRQVRRLLAVEYSSDIDAGLAIGVDQAVSVAHQSASGGVFALKVD